MPHVNSSGGDDLTSTDEVKVYKDEGEEENRSSENLLEDKHELVTETEEEKRSDSLIGGYGSGVSEKRAGTGQDGKTPEPDRVGVPPGSYPLFSPYSYPNGATVPGSLLNHPYLNGASRLHNGTTAMFFHSLANSLASHHDKGSKVPGVQPPHPSSLSSLMMYPSSELAQPPPAHMGIPPVHIDPKTGLPRPPMYAIPPPPGQFPHHLYSDISQMQWNGHPGYSMATGYRGPYPGLSSSPLARFSPPGLLPHHHGMPHGMQHPAIITPGPKQEIHNSENHRWEHPLLHGHDHSSNASDSQTEVTPKKPHIKKPLNAFMLFMKEQRAKVAAECTLKESAAINQILGRRWHALDRSEQAKYYEMARKEKELHLQLYPGWSARDNYATHTKKKKRKREQTGSETKNTFGQEAYSGEYLLPNSGSTTSATTTTINNNNNHHHHHTSTGFDLTSSPRAAHQPLHFSIPETQKECTNPKKCRARFGLDQQSQWCKPCRRKKKCIRFMTGEDGSGSDDDDLDDDLDDEDEEGGGGGGSVATIDSTTTDLEGGSSQGSPAPSTSSTSHHHPGGAPATTTTSAATAPTSSATSRGGSGVSSSSGSGSGNGNDPAGLQHPVVSQSHPGTPPPAPRRPLYPLHVPHHLPHLAASPSRLLPLNSGSTGSGHGGGGGGGSGGSSPRPLIASHQKHSLSDSNQDSLHSTVKAGAASSNSDPPLGGATSSSTARVSTVLAT